MTTEETKPETWFELLDTTIAGAGHAVRDNGLNLNHLTHGGTLTLVREPNNQFDTNAIRCDYAGQKCGYIPAVQAVWLSKFLDHGFKVRAVVGHVFVQRALVSITLEVQAPT